MGADGSNWPLASLVEELAAIEADEHAAKTGWKWAQPLRAGDVVLDAELPALAAKETPGD